MYFFDTYAIIERLLGNQNYAFTQDLVVVTTKYNVCELSYAEGFYFLMNSTPFMSLNSLSPVTKAMPFLSA